MKENYSATLKKGGGRGRGKCQEMNYGIKEYEFPNIGEKYFFYHKRNMNER